MCSNRKSYNPALVSDNTPVNLLGRDAICKLGLQIWCTLDRVYVIRQETVANQMMVRPNQLGGTANVYWIGQAEEAVQVFLEKWSVYLHVVKSDAYKPKLQYHCMIACHEGEDVWYGQIWDQEVKQQEAQLVT